MADSVPPGGPEERDVELVMAAMERRESKNLDEFIQSLSNNDDADLLDAVDRFLSAMGDLTVTEGEWGAHE